MSESAGSALDAALAAEAEAYRLLLAGRPAQSELRVARDAYLESHGLTGASSWGRLLGALKMAILAGDGPETAAVAERAVVETEGVASPAAGYVRALAEAALGRRPAVAPMLAAGEAFERTGRALAALADGDRAAYGAALAEIVADFEAREAFLTGVAIADTAVVLEVLAESRGLAASPDSALVPR